MHLYRSQNSFPVQTRTTQGGGGGVLRINFLRIESAHLVVPYLFLFVLGKTYVGKTKWRTGN